MKVKAKVGLTYNGKPQKRNSVFTMKDKHAKVFQLLGKVEEYKEPKPTPKAPPRRRATATRAVQPQENNAVEETDPDKETKVEEINDDSKPTGTRRNYTRRDMTAED